jgi:hypothetical protein
MRHLLLASATCLALLGAPAFAGDDAKPAAEHAKVANTIDPLSGKAVDEKVGTLELTWKKKTVVVGFSSKESLDKAKASDEKTKEQIAEAAKEHEIIQDGKLVDDGEKKHHKKKDQ